MGRLTKTEQRWQWLARRIWPHDLNGWSGRTDLGKGDMAILERRVQAGQIERDDTGMVRLTEAGRRALAQEQG